MSTTRLLGLLVATVGLTTATGAAQPVMPQGPPHIMPVRERAPDPAVALRVAYRTIGAAEARGAGGRYLDAARTHYRAALGKLTASPLAAAHEARAAAALARAALDERPLPTPRDLPSPPPLTSPAPPMRGRFDPEALARSAALENTPEANDLAKAALEADVAGERAAFAGNREEGLRQRRLARDLAAAVHLLADADHPQPVPTQRRRPMMQSAELEEPSADRDT